MSRRCISKDTYEKFVLPEVQHELRKMTMLEPKKTLNSPFDINKSPYVTLMTKTQLEEVSKPLYYLLCVHITHSTEINIVHAL